ncbi:MAG: tetratricopeptide repeat protein [Magnetospirillum sp.]|nr:tetratricopeptide repeat protein [Magnetospirillum sp.]
MTTPLHLKDAALAALRSGAIADALRLAEQAVALDPSFPEGWTALGVSRLVAGDAAAAVRDLERALALRPLFPSARLNLAVARMAAGDLDGAEADLATTVTQDPWLDVSGALGRLLAGRREAWRLAPNPATAAALARLLGPAGQPGEAVEVLRAALAGVPDDTDLWNLLGNTLFRAGRIDEAVAAAETAARLAPDDPLHGTNVAGLLSASGKGAAALARIRRVLVDFPGHVRANIVAAELLEAQDAAAEEVRAHLAAAAAADSSATEVSRACEAAVRAVDWNALDPLLDRLRPLLDSGTAQPFRLAMLPFSLGAMKTNAVRFAAETWPARVPLAVPATAKGRLRLGYLSPDFRAHPVGTTIPDLFRHHDRQRFEVFAYAFGGKGEGSERQRIAESCDRFVDIDALPDHAAARRLRDDGIDVAIDLAGHTAMNRLGILSFRPAPVQMHFLGYPGTTGAAFIDYIFADPWTIPPADEPHYVERVIRLPHTYLINSARCEPGPAPARRQLGFADDAVVYCSFNHSYKVGRAMFSVWCDILAAVPQAVLWMRLDSPRAEATFRAAMEGRGLDPARLFTAPRIALSEHFARYRVADLMLDTLPYGAHTTAADALWAGCPLLTLPGESFAGRAGAALAAAAGLSESIARDLDDYRDKAIAVGRSPALRAAWRAKAAEARNSVVFDTAAFTRAFEAGLLAAWQRAVAGDSPAAIDLTAG